MSGNTDIAELRKTIEKQAVELEELWDTLDIAREAFIAIEKWATAYPLSALPRGAIKAALVVGGAIETALVARKSNDSDLANRSDRLVTFNVSSELEPTQFNFAAHIERQREFSIRTFGPHQRTRSITDHIRKELDEIEANPSDLEEWIDVLVLAIEGAWRTGASPWQIIRAWVAKQAKNESRKWPDWRTIAPGAVIEHEGDGH